MASARIGAGAFWAVLGAVFVWRVIPAETYPGDPGELAPAALPFACMGLIGLLGLVEVVAGVAALRAAPARRGAGGWDGAALARFAALALFLAAALGALRWLGFVGGGMAIIAALALALGERRWLRLALVAGGVPPLLWALAFYGLRISLPGGPS